MISIFDTGAFHLDASQGIGTVKNHHFYSLFSASPHHQSQSADERVRTGSHVLYVINHNVYALEHFGSRLACRAVKGVYRQAGFFVPA